LYKGNEAGYKFNINAGIIVENMKKSKADSVFTGTKSAFLLVFCGFLQ